jgi:hypothetical protein
MNLILRIPEAMAIPLAAAGGDLERRALEALAAEEYRAGRLTKPQLCAALGFQVLNEFDGFLKAHGVFEDYSINDLEHERQIADRLGL